MSWATPGCTSCGLRVSASAPSCSSSAGNTVILLGRLNDDQQSERALADLARRYASSLPDARGPVEPTAWWVRSALGLALLILVVSPFLIWRSTLAIRARTHTPHRHGRDEPPPPPRVVDVCTVASKARRRARRLFVAQVGIFLVAGAVATNYALAAFIVFATPVAWLLGRTVTCRRGGAPPGRRWSMAGSPGPALVTFFAWPLIATMLAVGGAAAAEGAFGPEAERGAGVRARRCRADHRDPARRGLAGGRQRPERAPTDDGGSARPAEGPTSSRRRPCSTSAPSRTTDCRSARHLLVGGP